MKKTFLYLLIFSFFNYIGCYSSKPIGKEKFFSESNIEPINDVTIVTNDDNRIVLDEVTYQVIADTLYIEGINRTSTKVYGQLIDEKIALADIQYVEIDEIDGLKTTGCVISLTGLIVLIIAFIAAVNSFDKPAKSCEYEGSKY